MAFTLVFNFTYINHVTGDSSHRQIRDYGVGLLARTAKLGKVQINLHRDIPVGFVVKQVRVVKKAMGWFAVIAIESDISLPDPVPHRHFIGIDVGLNNYLATSDGFIEPGRKLFKCEHRRLKVLQRRLSKKKKRSSNYEKARL
ncbi:MAG: transposase [Okeania sp. SIO2D1]|nr:transposase [Okeania sp. SIO2D1]